MSLTIGTGPLGRHGGAANYSFQSPAHRLLLQPYGPRLRARVGGHIVLDSTRAQLLHETGILPVAYAPLQDFDQARLTRTATTTHCPFKGDASYWSIDGSEDVLWAYEQPLEAAAWLRGFAALDRHRVDAWLVEDEEVVGHVRDPYTRIDALPSSRRAEVRLGEHVLASSDAPVLLFETGLQRRAYLPRGSVAEGALEPSPTRTICPYKGEASYWHVRTPPGERLDDAAWTYEVPRPEAQAIAGHVCFDADGIAVAVE